MSTHWRNQCISHRYTSSEIGAPRTGLLRDISRMSSKAKKTRVPGEKDPEVVAQGQRLKLAREQAGFASAADGAKAVGESDDTYRQYENGTRGYWQYAAHFAARFGVPPSWLLWGAKEDPIFEVAQAIAGVEDKKLAMEVVKGALAPLMKRRG